MAVHTSVRLEERQVKKLDRLTRQMRRNRSEVIRLLIDLAEFEPLPTIRLVDGERRGDPERSSARGRVISG